MNLVRIFYIGAMALGGVALGVASLRWPVIHDGPVPPLMYANVAHEKLPGAPVAALPLYAYTWPASEATLMK